MTALLLALAASAVYGSADFLGGLATRRASMLAVVALSQLAGLLALLPMVAMMGGSPDPISLQWGAAAGIVGGAGVALLYRALAGGSMSIAAPIAAVAGIAVPVLVGLALGDRPGLAPLIGVVLAAGAIVLISRPPPVPIPHAATSQSAVTPRHREPVAMALGAGLAIGFFYVCLQRSSGRAGLWPLVASRTVSVAVFFLLAAATGKTLRLPAGVRILVLAGGVADVVANALYLLAVRRGMLSVIATLSSLYPAATVLLARVVLRERLGAVQWVGLGIAAVAVVLIASGG
ncbi:MAG: DMT family transporter [Gemmatimonadaceae bacterium]